MKNRINLTYECVEKESKIKTIKGIIEEWGTTSVSELELDCSIVLNNIGNNIVELIETFELDGVGTIVYDDEIEINYNSYQYVELPIDVINEILDILEKYADYMELTNKAY